MRISVIGLSSVILTQNKVTYVDRRTCLHMPSDLWSFNSDTHQIIDIQKRNFCLDWYTIFKPDWINKKDHMLISGIEPSPVILTQKKVL